MPIAIIALPKPAPSVAASASARIRKGKACNASTIPHDDPFVPEAAVVADQHPQRGAQQQRQADGVDRCLERDPRPIDHARQLIAPELVGAHGVLGAFGLLDLVELLVEWVVGC
jgi:hypothetical protein